MLSVTCDIAKQDVLNLYIYIYIYIYASVLNWRCIPILLSSSETQGPTLCTFSTSAQQTLRLIMLRKNIGGSTNAHSARVTSEGSRHPKMSREIPANVYRSVLCAVGLLALGQSRTTILSYINIFIST